MPGLLSQRLQPRARVVAHPQLDRCRRAGGARSRLRGDLRDHPSARSAFVRCDAATRFEIGSVTEALTGLLLADALERGEVTLQTQVGEVIAKAHGTPLGEVTSLELCTHTSGLPRLALTPMALLRVPLHGLLGLDPYRGTSPTSLLSAAARQHLRRRGHHRYSNLGAAVLGQVVATAAGRDFREVLRERLLDPLSMAGAGVARRVFPRAVGAGAPARHRRRPADRPVLDDRHRRGTGRQMVWHNGATGGYSAFFALFPQARRAVVVMADTSGRKKTERVATALARWLARGRQDL